MMNIIQTFLRDLRYSIRVLIKTPAFAVVAILSLALGIGANTIVFSVVNAVLLKSLPYNDPSSLVLIWGDSENSASLKGRNQVSATDVADYRAQSTSFEEVSTYTGWYPLMSGDGSQGQAERVAGIQVGDGFFKVMKTQPLLGRVFYAEEQKEGQDRVIILGHALWTTRFGSDPNVVGKTIQLNSRPYTIVGVLGPDARPLPTTLVEPEGQFYRPVAEAYNDSDRNARHLRSIARLKPGVTLEQAKAEMAGIAKRLEQEHPITNKSYGVNVVSITEDTVGGLRGTLAMIFGAVFFVLLVACANVANLLLARSTARHKEITIRAAIGAGRWQLVRQLLVESLLLSVFGGVIGLLIATWGLSVIETLGSKLNPMFTDLQVDLRTLGFTLGLSILTALIFGLAPALQLSKPDLTNSLKDGGRSGSSGIRNRLRSGLVVSEIAMTLILLVCAGLLIKTVLRITKVDKGFNSENVLTMNIGLPAARYPKPEDSVRFYQQTTDRIAEIPGVKAAAITSVMPLTSNFDGRGLAVEDHPRPRGEEFSVDLYVMTPGYLNAMEIPLLKGRPLTGGDREKSEKVALINNTMAQTFWPGAEPLGRRIRLVGDDGNETQQWRTIVGVVNDVSQYALDKKPPMQIYLPHAQFPTSFNTIVVKTTGDPKALTGAVKNAILAIDKDQAVYSVATLDELLGESIVVRRFLMFLLMVFAGIALILAAIGIYGVMSFVVTQRTREIGIRMALGAQTRDVLAMVLKNGMALAVIGVAVGLVAAFALTRLLRSLLFGVTATDAATFALVPLGVVAVVLLACYLPARRASKVNPLIALRTE
ncbi:MAG TPA: ABC transporter permease [Pyrinomonadaceae bacterium]|nr:ABC transporter permease [Pyrinomonadaceae bacterium]